MRADSFPRGTGRRVQHQWERDFFRNERVSENGYNRMRSAIAELFRLGVRDQCSVEEFLVSGYVKDGPDLLY